MNPVIFYRWTAALLMLPACGSRITETGNTDDGCRENCDPTSSSPCSAESCAASSEHETSGDSSTSDAILVTLPHGAGESTAGNESDGGGCRVAYEHYPVGALVPADGCGTSRCTCDATGTLVDCSEPGVPCPFDGPGPIKPCSVPTSELFSDGYTFEDAYILDNTLTITVSHTGGCTTHDFAVCFRAVPESEQGYHFSFIHDAHGDACESSLERTLHFDLTPMAQHAMDRLGTTSGIIETEYGVFTFGDLTCARREEAARIAVTDVLNVVDRSCTEDEDCVSTRFTADCTEECNAISRADQVSKFDRLRETLQAGACAGFLDSGCLQQFPECERRPAACIQGKCEVARP